MDIEEMILREWERAGGIYAEAARQVREDLKKKGEAVTSPITPLTAKKGGE